MNQNRVNEQVDWIAVSIVIDGATVESIRRAIVLDHQEDGRYKLYVIPERPNKPMYHVITPPERIRRVGA